MESPRHVYKLYVRATPEAIWKAITDPAQTGQYFFGTRVNSTWEQGAVIEYANGNDGVVAISGSIVEIDPPRKLVHTFSERWDPEAVGDPPSRVTWEIEPAGEVCAVTLIHDNFDSETHTYNNVGGGWPMILSNLKTLLETGTPFSIQM